MIWVVFALFTGAAVFAVLWPLSRAPATTDARELDVAFYRAQTHEIDRDVARGVIGTDEAEIARTEAARRLVSASERAPADVVVASTPFASRAVALGALVFIPLLALGLYVDVGAPNLPDDPLEARLDADPSKMDMATMIARIERNVAKNPDDGKGWSILARIYQRLGRDEDAIAAYRNEIRVLGPSEERLSALGEAETAVNGGRVSVDARKDFERAVALDPASPRGLFYLGVAAEQDGDSAKAITIWTKLVADSPPGAPWLPAVRSHIAAAGGAAVPSEASAGVPKGPMADAVAAMPPDRQQAMIHRMVDGLADRLKSNGRDIDGWLKLVRAYRVLDEPDKARVALADARRNFTTDPGATKRLADLARELGLES